LSSKQKIELQPETAKEWYDSAVIAFQSKDASLALRLIAKAINLDQDNPEYHAFIALVFKALGHNTEVVKAYEKSIQLDPNNPDTHHNFGSFFLEIGLSDKAMPHFENALKVNPQHPQALNALGMIHFQAGDTNKAKELFFKAIEIKPDFDLVYLNLGDLFNTLHHPRIAIKWYNKYSGNEADHPGVLIKKAKVFLALGNLEKCLKLCKKALKINSNSTQGNATLGQCYEKMGQYELAHSAFQKVQETEIAQNAQTLCAQGMVYFEQIKDYQKAKEHYLKAIEVSPNYLQAHLHLAHLYIIEGDLKFAEETLNTILKISPGHPQALRQLAHIKKTDIFDHLSIQELEEKLENTDNHEHQKNDLRFALADCLDQKQSYDRAFKHLKTANDISSKNSKFHINIIKKQIDTLVNYFNKDIIQELSQYGNNSQSPVFIVGMPRSGTTLSEQILSSHPSIFGAGELKEMSNMKFKIQSMTKKTFPHAIDHLNKKDFSKIANDHINFLGTLSPGSSRVIDKMPFNLYLIGMIACFFPNAKFIHCLRHPLDTCLSNYFLKFSDRMSFSYNLKHLGQVYNAHTEIMKHWNDLLPGRIITQNYEDLIESPESETKKLLEHLDLDWNDACLSHHENKRPVKTASNWQVRQPIYKTSVGRWKNYKNYLQPLADELNFNLNLD